MDSKLVVEQMSVGRWKTSTRHASQLGGSLASWSAARTVRFTLIPRARTNAPTGLPTWRWYAQAPGDHPDDLPRSGNLRVSRGCVINGSAQPRRRPGDQPGYGPAAASGRGHKGRRQAVAAAGTATAHFGGPRYSGPAEPELTELGCPVAAWRPHLGSVEQADQSACAQLAARRAPARYRQSVAAALDVSVQTHYGLLEPDFGYWEA